MKRDTQLGLTSDPFSRYRRTLVARAMIVRQTLGSHRSHVAHQLEQLTLSRYVRYLTETAVRDIRDPRNESH